MSEKKVYNKPALDLDEKIKLLKDRGLIITDVEKAKHYLLHIGYFRLTGYFKFYQDKETDIFHDGVNFEQVVHLYAFDRKLRLLTLDAIEKIEVSLKSNINYTLYKDYGVFWYLDKSFFALENERNNEIYNNFINKVIEIQEKQKSIFVKEYFIKYDGKYLPCWMLFEELTIGSISTILNVLKPEYCTKIASNYSTYYVDLRKWINLLVQVRNISAHHSRLWNNDYLIKPRVQDVIFKNVFLLEKNNNTNEVSSNYYNTALIINYLLKCINKNFSWFDDLKKLFDDFSEVDKTKMGFVNDWQKNFGQ